MVEARGTSGRTAGERSSRLNFSILRVRIPPGPSHASLSLRFEVERMLATCKSKSGTLSEAILVSSVTIFSEYEVD